MTKYLDEKIGQLIIQIIDTNTLQFSIEPNNRYECFLLITYYLDSNEISIRCCHFFSEPFLLTKEYASALVDVAKRIFDFANKAEIDLANYRKEVRIKKYREEIIGLKKEIELLEKEIENEQQSL